MLPARFDTQRKCRMCFAERKVCKCCHRCQEHCRCDDSLPIVRTLEIHGGGCNYRLEERADDHTFVLHIQDKERKQHILISDVWLFALEDVAQRILLENVKSGSCNQVFEAVVNDAPIEELELILAMLPTERIEALYDVIQRLLKDNA